MVSLLTTNKFSFLIAKRNALHNKNTTAVIIITLSLIFAIFMMMMGIKEIYKTVFIGDAQNAYPNIDIVISYDEYSEARFINKRNLTDDYEEINYALSFFNLQVLTEKGEDTFYSQLLSSLPHEFEILIDKEITIRDDEAIISKSLADEKNLKVGDTFSFYILNDVYEYTVREIIADNGLFSGRAFFVEKADLLEKIYDVSYLTNFGNAIYINTDNIDEVYDKLLNDVNYQNYGIRLVVDEEQINSLINEYISSIALAGILVLVALIIVLNSLFLIVLKDIFQEIGVFETLGDNKKLGYRVCFFQWTISIFVSFIIGLFIAHLVIYIGARFYGVNDFILINPLIILLSFIIILVFISIKNFILVRKFYIKNSIEKIRDKRFVLAIYNHYVFVAVAIIFGAVLIFKPFSLRFDSLIIVLSSIYLSLSIIIFIAQKLARLFSKKKSLFSLFNARHIEHNKNIHQSLSVVFVALIVIVVMLTVRFFIDNQIKEVRDSNDFDIVMTNIHNYDDNLINEIKSYDTLEVNPSFIHEKVIVRQGESSSFMIKMIVSVDIDKFDDYFNYNLDEIDQVYIDNSLPYILLPQSYEIVYDIKKGDILELDLSPDLRGLDFVVAGFVRTDFDQFAYTNLVDKIDSLDLKYNSIMINSNNPEDLFDDLIKDYGGQMYYLIDARSTLEDQIAISKNVLALFTVITIFVVFSFMFVVFNNTYLKFFALKNDYSKVKVLGSANSLLFKNLFKELLILVLSLVLVGLVEVFILSSYLKNLLLFFDYYKNMSVNYFALILGYAIVFFSLFLSYVYYYNYVKHINLADEIRVL
jgi:putative ABC transport system permease protein